MRKLSKPLLLALMLPALLSTPNVWADNKVNDFPTTDRVEFVLECMNKNGGEQQFIYKCSCMIDEIAKVYKYDDYVEAATVSRYREMGGERMGEFRDPDSMKDASKKYRAVFADAGKTCGLSKK